MVKHLTRSIKVLLLLVILAVAGALLWLRQDIRSLEWARPYLIEALNRPDAPYTVTYTDASIDWRHWSQFGLLRVKNVTLAGQDGTVFATLPAMYISIDPLGLITHRHSLNTILLHKPKLYFTRDAGKVIRLGVDNDTASIPFASLLAFFNTGDNNTMRLNAALPFRRLIIDRATLVFTDAVTASSITSADTSFKLARSSGNIEASLTFPFLYNEKQVGAVEANLTSYARHGLFGGGVHVLEVVMDRVPAQFACLLTDCGEGNAATGIVSGRGELSLDDMAAPLEGEVDLKTADAVLSLPNYFAEPLLFSKAAIKARASDHFQNIQVTQLSTTLTDTEFSVTGRAQHEAAGWNVVADAIATKPLDITKLYKYWPLPLAPNSRTWVIGSMKAGYGDQMRLKLALTPQDWDAPVLPDSAIDANLTAHNVTVEYLPGFPLMKGVNGNVHFTGKTIRIDTNTGSMLNGTTLQHANIFFPDLNQAGTPMEIACNVKAPAADAATILGLNYFAFDDSLKLNPDTIKGSVEAALKLKFNAFSREANPEKPVDAKTIDFSQVDYDITAHLQDVAQEKLAGKISVSNANAVLTATNAGMDFNGTLMVGGATALELKAAQKTGGDVTLTASGSIGKAQLLQLGIPDDGHVGEGTAHVKAQILAKKDDLLVREATMDVKDLALDIPELSWSKKRGVPGSITVDGSAGKSGDTIAYRMAMHADDLAISDATLGMNAAGELASLSAPSIVTAQNNLAINYHRSEDGFEVALTGRRLDASGSYAKSDHGLLKDFPPIHLTLDLAELVLDAQMPVTNIKGFLQCSRVRCDAANIRANLGKSGLTASITQKAGQRQLQMNASNAGDLLRAVSFTDRMYGGTFDLKGTYDDSKTTPMFVGRLIINDFKLKNSAILGRILSIGSLTGLSNALTGDGIAFNKFAVSIGQQAGVIVVKDGKANGNAMGITVEGTVDTNSAKLNLKGVIVPAYALNSLLGKIPIIGALAGGEGEGLIAFNYSVDGTYENPDVSVNPLSGLTPGFLRGIFGVFDSKEKKPTLPTPAAKPVAREQESKPDWSAAGRAAEPKPVAAPDATVPAPSEDSGEE